MHSNLTLTPHKYYSPSSKASKAFIIPWSVSGFFLKVCGTPLILQTLRHGMKETLSLFPEISVLYTCCPASQHHWALKAQSPLEMNWDKQPSWASLPSLANLLLWEILLLTLQQLWWWGAMWYKYCPAQVSCEYCFSWCTSVLNAMVLIQLASSWHSALMSRLSPHGSQDLGWEFDGVIAMYKLAYLAEKHSKGRSSSSNATTPSHHSQPSRRDKHPKPGNQKQQL